MDVIDINAKDSGGNTALLIAAKTGNFEAMQLLLSKGEGVNVINNNGQTALSIIASLGSVKDNKEKLRLLFKYGADLEASGSFSNIDALKSIQKKVEEERYKLTKTICMRSFNASDQQQLLAQQKAALAKWGEINTPCSKCTKPEYIKQVGTAPILVGVILSENKDLLGHLLTNVPNINVNIREENGYTPLLRAIEKGYYNIIEMLIDNSECIVDIQKDNGFNSLMIAVDKLDESKGAEFDKWKTIILKLIKKSDNVDLVNSQNQTSLIKLIQYTNNPQRFNNLSEVILTLIQKSNNVDIQKKGGVTAIIQALKMLEQINFSQFDTYIRIIFELIKKSENVDLQDDNGINALMKAICILHKMNTSLCNKWNVTEEAKTASIKKLKNVISELIKRSQNLNAENVLGMTALSIAGKYDFVDIVNEILIRKQKLDYDLSLELLHSTKDTFPFILEKHKKDISGSVITKKVLNGLSVLDVFKKFGYINRMALLLPYLTGDDKELKNEIKQEITKVELLKKMLNEFEKKENEAYRKAQREKEAEGERTAVILNKMDQKWLEGDNKGDQKIKAVSQSFKNAAKNGDFNQVQNLLILKNERGERLISEDTINEGFLLASENGSDKFVELLLDEVDINHKDPKTGNTALMLAAQNGYLTLVGDLIANGATIDLNNKGYTALRFAAENGHADVVEYLLDAGARMRYLYRILDEVKKKIAQNDSLIEDYKKIQEILSERQQDASSPDSSESEGANKTWSVYFWNNVLKAYGSLDKGQKKETDRLLEEIKKNPFERRLTPGQKPEPLYGNLSGFFSRRINGGDRLVYRVKGDRIFVVACDDHYEDLNKFSKSEIRSLSSFNNEWKKGVLIKLN